jgi:hypothetical protein
VKEPSKEPPPANQRQVRCPTCTDSAYLSTRFLDPRSGKTIRLYLCRCGENIWDD